MMTRSSGYGGSHEGSATRAVPAHAADWAKTHPYEERQQIPHTARVRPVRNDNVKAEDDAKDEANATRGVVRADGARGASR